MWKCGCDLSDTRLYKDVLYQTETSMWCCEVILWRTEDKRVVSAIDSTRENIGLGEI